VDSGTAIYPGIGLLALAILAVFISAIMLSYRIERRSEGLQNRSGLPRNAMIFHTITNWKVARDPETQALRRTMNRRLLIVLAGLVMMAGIVKFADRVG